MTVTTITATMRIEHDDAYDRGRIEAGVEHTFSGAELVDPEQPTRRLRAVVDDVEGGTPPRDRLALWLTTNAGLPDDASHEQVTDLIEALSGSSVPDAMRELRRVRSWPPEEGA